MIELYHIGTREQDVNCVDGQGISQSAQEVVQLSDGGQGEVANLYGSPLSQKVFKVLDESAKKVNHHGVTSAASANPGLYPGKTAWSQRYFQTSNTISNS